jgi:predicted transcriptional regulator
MKKHSGMRPQDIIILLKIASRKDQAWLMKDLAHELGISASEVSESLNRSAIAGLLSKDKKRLMSLALCEFLEFGLRYVYPQQPGAMVRGIATAHSAPPLSNEIVSNEPFVIPYAKGNLRGQAVESLHSKLAEACLKDNAFYELIALSDCLRVGRMREKKMAMDELRKRIC